MMPRFFIFLLSFAVTAASLPEENDEDMFSRGFNIRDYLNPELFEYEGATEDLKMVLNEGRVAVIRNAFREDFADYVYRKVNGTHFVADTQFFGDGFSFTHTNVWERENQDAAMQQIHDIFASVDTRHYVSQLLGQDTLAEGVKAAPSHYRAGDYSGPHSDLDAARKVAFVWHLTKNWKPEWGGALYWCMERPEHAYVHASYNTLILFETRGSTQHFVTRVSPHATEKRLAFNGWWNAIWNPLVEGDDQIETYLKEPEHRKHATILQYQQLEERLQAMRPYVSEEKYDHFNQLMDPLRLSMYPLFSRNMFIVDGNNPRVDNNINWYVFSLLSENNEEYEDHYDDVDDNDGDFWEEAGS